MTITAERKLKKAKIDVMRSTLPGLRLWSGIMSIGKTSICDTTPTAYTNGRDETYGRDFVERLPVAQLSFVCLHEAMHKGLRHLTIWRKLFDEDKQLANIACDYVVNRMIVAADPTESVVQFPRNPDGSRMGLYDKKYDGMSARQVFDLLKQEKKDNPDGGGGGGGEGGGEGFDEHGSTPHKGNCRTCTSGWSPSCLLPIRVPSSTGIHHCCWQWRTPSKRSDIAGKTAGNLAISIPTSNRTPHSSVLL